MKRIYLDHAASTPLLPEVLEIMQEALTDYSGNPSSIHAEGRKARAQIEDARKSIAKHLNASIGEIFFTSGGTESNNTAIKCAVRDLGIKKIISSPIEHHAVIHTIESCRRDFNTEIKFLDVDQYGRIDLSELEKELGASHSPTLVSLMHINNELGNINPLEEISLLCKKYRAYLHTDAVQSVGHISINLQQIQLDFLSASAHKFNGPKGIGFIYISNRIKINPFIDGGGQERNMRGGTESVHNILGMAKALNLAIGNMESHNIHIFSLKNYFTEKLKELNIDIRINGDPNGHVTHTILSVSFPANPKSDLLLMNFDIAGVSVSGGSACVSGSEQESHVLNAIRHPTDRKTIRFSFSHLNTPDEIDQVLSLLHTWYPVYSA